MRRMFNFFYAFLLALLGMGAALMAEDITLTTYYPAPYGAYDELSTTGNTNLATTSGNVGIGTTDPDGYKLYVDGTLRSASLTLPGGSLMGESTNALTLRSPATKEMYFDYGNMGLFMRNRDALYRTDVYINSAGSVGIGTVNPGVYKCYIAGTGYLNAVAWDCASDVRLKENISYIQSGLNIIEQLKPVKFDYIKGEKRQAGFLAQEVEVVLPDIVTKGQDGMLAMKTDSIIPYLVKAIQEQQKEIKALKAKLGMRQ